MIASVFAECCHRRLHRRGHEQRHVDHGHWHRLAAGDQRRGADAGGVPRCLLQEQALGATERSSGLTKRGINTYGLKSAGSHYCRKPVKAMLPLELAPTINVGLRAELVAMGSVRPLNAMPLAVPLTLHAELTLSVPE